jgi:hypothetical protein
LKAVQESILVSIGAPLRYIAKEWDVYISDPDSTIGRVRLLKMKKKRKRRRRK